MTISSSLSMTAQRTAWVLLLVLELTSACGKGALALSHDAGPDLPAASDRPVGALSDAGLDHAEQGDLGPEVDTPDVRPPVDRVTDVASVADARSVVEDTGASVETATHEDSDAPEHDGSGKDAGGDAGDDAGDDARLGDDGSYDADVTAVNPVKLVITPSTAAFAATLVTNSAPIAFVVANMGDAAASPLSVTITGPNASEFAITQQTCLSRVLASGETCSVSVVFAPPLATSGAAKATLAVVDQGQGGSGASAALTGTIFATPIIGITPELLDLGQVKVGTTGAPILVTLTNSGDHGTGALTISASSPAVVIADDTCAGKNLDRNGSCTFTLALKPTSVGSISATLSIAVEALGTVTRTITGTGIP
jgi:hypothetical protein